MAFKLINATEIKEGTAIIINNEPCIVKSIEMSKTGKHGASKCRIEAIGITDDKKRVVAVPGHERFEVPMIEKRKAQVLSVGEMTNVMDLENFETFDIAVPSELRESIKEGSNVEYWIIEGRKIIKRLN